SSACLEQNLIARAMPNGDILGFAPPLSITRTEVDDIIKRTAKALNSVRDLLTKEYSWKG
ncbi:MAG: aspartate aminotransferase family protein, partial [SAR324 cluster bacterium]|nr:aspartate aminotransferase family protein [SAR324 cluster bacterium]